jgi:hypothetical protein
MYYDGEEVELEGAEEEARVEGLGDGDEAVEKADKKLESLHLL